MKVIVLSGISGSGKSTLARKLWNDLEPGHYCKVVSADDYFMVKGEDGTETYKFDPTKLTNAHGECYKKYLDVLYFERGFYDLLIVDNTNLSVEEISPYMLAASAFGVEAEVMTLQVPLDVAQGRNVHGVSQVGSARQYDRLKSRKLPPWWKHTEVAVDGAKVAPTLTIPKVV